MLRVMSAPVSDSVQATSIFRDLRATLHEFRRTHGFGRGISAVQIGVLERMIYLEFEGAPYCLINPEWAFMSAEKFQKTVGFETTPPMLPLP